MQMMGGDGYSHIKIGVEDINCRVSIQVVNLHLDYQTERISCDYMNFRRTLLVCWIKVISIYVITHMTTDTRRLDCFLTSEGNLFIYLFIH